MNVMTFIFIFIFYFLFFPFYFLLFLFFGLDFVKGGVARRYVLVISLCREKRRPRVAASVIDEECQKLYRIGIDRED